MNYRLVSILGPTQVCMARGRPNRVRILELSRGWKLGSEQCPFSGTLLGGFSEPGGDQNDPKRAEKVEFVGMEIGQ